MAAAGWAAAATEEAGSEGGWAEAATAAAVTKE